jgi:secondary thiamine-phosphate synthase enzyme
LTSWARDGAPDSEATVQTIDIQTQARLQVIDVTDSLAALVTGLADGLACFNTPHTTAALIVCEPDEALQADILKVADTLLAGLRPFQHARNSNPNAEAHLVSALFGATLTLAVEDGRLDLGRWQRILLVELDGPKRREIRCKLLRASP